MSIAPIPNSNDFERDRSLCQEVELCRMSRSQWIMISSTVREVLASSEMYIEYVFASCVHHSLERYSFRYLGRPDTGRVLQCGLSRLVYPFIKKKKKKRLKFAHVEASLNRP